MMTDMAAAEAVMEDTEIVVAIAMGAEMAIEPGAPTMAEMEEDTKIVFQCSFSMPVLKLSLLLNNPKR